MQVLNSIMDEFIQRGEGLGDVPEAFTAVRMVDVSAMQDLEHMNLCLTVRSYYQCYRFGRYIG